MKKHNISIVCIGALLFLYGTAHATVWYVHPDSTLNLIQAGIDSCSTGDTVLVAPGTYIENINYNGKAITVTSELGPDTTIIDGSNPVNPDTGSVVLFISGEDTNSVLNGFTITNGTGTLDTIYWIYNGGGIFCFDNSSPTITDNIITENRTWWAGGIECWSSSPIIMGNIISNNIADTAAGGIECLFNGSPYIANNIITGNTSIYGGGVRPAHDCSPTIADNIITHNHAYVSGGGIQTAYNSPSIITGNTIDSNTAYLGGGIFCAGETPPNVSYIANNTIRNNTAYYGGGIDCYEVASPEIHNNIITGNTATIGGGIRCNNNSSPSIIGDTITDNTATYGGGIFCTSVGTSPLIESCYISNDSVDGIYCTAGSDPEIHYNDIIDNIGYGVCNVYASIIVDAEHNWWGDSTGPYHPITNPGGLGDTVSDYVDYDPWIGWPGIEEYKHSRPAALVLQISPNPFTERANIEFSTGQTTENVKLQIYDVTGRLIRQWDCPTIKLSNQITWDGRDNSGKKVPSGVYFLKLKTEDYGATEKLLLIR